MSDLLKRFVPVLSPGILATYDPTKNLLLISEPFYRRATAAERRLLWRCTTTIELVSVAEAMGR